MNPNLEIISEEVTLKAKLWNPRGILDTDLKYKQNKRQLVKAQESQPTIYSLNKHHARHAM